MEEVELVVVGGGVAGCAAAAEAARMGLRVVLLAPEGAMGALATIEEVEGLFGVGVVSGYEFCPTLLEQAEAEGVEIRVSAASTLQRDGDMLRLVTDNGTLDVRAVVAASGTAPLEAPWPAGEHLIGRGISHCASCDGPLFSGSDVAVVGGGDSGLQEALTLAAHHVGVTIFEQQEALTAMDSLQRRVRANRSIRIRTRTRVIDVVGDDRVRSVIVEDLGDGSSEELNVGGVFVYIGRTPQSAWLADLDVLDETGRVIVDSSMRSPVRGLFAAGDVRADSPTRAAAAIGDGIAAAHAAFAFIQLAADITVP